jgi:hypothetical protein
VFHYIDVVGSLLILAVGLVVFDKLCDVLDRFKKKKDD